MFRARKKSKKKFRPFWPNWAPNLGQKGSFWVKFFKKMKKFQNFFFSIWMILSRKKAKKMRILDSIEFLSLFVSVRLCIFFGHRSSKMYAYSFFYSFFLSFFLSIYLSFFLSFFPYHYHPLFLFVFFLSFFLSCSHSFFRYFLTIFIFMRVLF